MRVQRASIEDLTAIAGEQGAFWGERDLSHLHHPMLIREFGRTALIVRASSGEIRGYLMGLLTPEGVGYIHLIAVRADHRGEGLGRALYAEFESIARRHGAILLRSITRPGNAGSIAFHRALGFSAVETLDYCGPGQTRIVFAREVGTPSLGMSN